ncbi:putative WRKY transcription factor 75 [Morella rubra]|uniref:Putative WRKY transcription factor 75 n=1 Tax=Morella rubra TaxID=262757 RepID=A0A6A1VWX4_9ROSI|nr:putative WRKY transcription factor 75 [Morella rubra]
MENPQTYFHANGTDKIKSEPNIRPLEANSIYEIGGSSASESKVKSRKKIKMHRFAFQTRSQVDILDDGYRWRKYGQKAVKDCKFPSRYRGRLQTSLSLRFLSKLGALSPAMFVAGDSCDYGKWIPGPSAPEGGGSSLLGCCRSIWNSSPNLSCRKNGLCFCITNPNSDSYNNITICSWIFHAFLRSYYRCTQKGCNVKKQIQRLSQDEEMVVTTYEGMHTHPLENAADSFEQIFRQIRKYAPL